jgi:serine/threonine-protein kinase
MEGRNGFIRVGQRLGKYRINRRLAEGSFAAVYRAYDTIAGIPVALKVPHGGFGSPETLGDFRREARITANLDHPSILPIKDAGFVDGVFLIAYPLGQRTLADRLQHRLSVETVVDYAEQMLEAVAFAHRRRIMHCDIKPENFILFENDRIRLADFGIAKVARRTLHASGSGTVGYIAPEQAMGRPSFRSDVFSLGLVIYRMLAGELPEWPFDWPMPGHSRMAKRVHTDVIQFLRRSLEIDYRKRYADARVMLAAFRRIRRHALQSRVASSRKITADSGSRQDWRTVRFRFFLKRYRTVLGINAECRRCRGPVCDSMCLCGWCGDKVDPASAKTRARCRCPRCKRGLKPDWRFCPWCFGKALNIDSSFRYPDSRYCGHCENPKCSGRVLMPFMRYCPWCRHKVRKKWKIEGSTDSCVRCGWGVLPEFWDFCPWCARSMPRKRRSALIR